MEDFTPCFSLITRAIIRYFLLISSDLLEKELKASTLDPNLLKKVLIKAGNENKDLKLKA